MTLPVENWDRKWWAALLLGAVFMLFPIAERAIFGWFLYPSEAALLLVLAFSGIYFLNDWLGFFNEKDYKIRLVTVLASLFLIGIGLSFMANEPTFSGLGKLKSFYLLPILLGLVIPILLRDVVKIRVVLQGWLYGIWAASLVAIISAFEGWLLYDGRLAGPYTSANYLAMLVAPGIFLSIYFFLIEHRSIVKWLVTTGLLLIGIVLFLTHSYATWFALFVSCFFGATLFFKGRAEIKWSHLILPLALLSCILLVEVRTEKWSQLVSLDPRSSLASRQTIWQVGLNIVSDHPLIGIGTANFQEKYLEYQKYYPPYLEWAVPTPHNLFLHFWLEGGILSLLAWLGMLTLLARYTWHGVKNESNIERRNAVILCAMLVLFYVLYGLVDTPYMKNDLVFAVWGSIGLLLASLRVKA